MPDPLYWKPFSRSVSATRRPFSRSTFAGRFGQAPLLAGWRPSAIAGWSSPDSFPTRSNWTSTARKFHGVCRVRSRKRRAPVRGLLVERAEVVPGVKGAQVVETHLHRARERRKRWRGEGGKAEIADPNRHVFEPLRHLACPWPTGPGERRPSPHRRSLLSSPADKGGEPQWEAPDTRAPGDDRDLSACPCSRSRAAAPVGSGQAPGPFPGHDPVAAIFWRRPGRLPRCQPRHG